MGKASRLFNGQAEQTLHAKVTPSTEQRDFLQQRWNNLADHLKARLAQHGYGISTWLQGSYKYGTLIKPVKWGDQYDVDLGLYFEWEPQAGQPEPAPGQLRTWVQRELHSYKENAPELKEVAEPAKERCSRAIFTRRFHIDTPTYHLDPQSDKRRLATLSGKWEDSDPKALYKWFKKVQSGAEREQMRRLIRYLKAWAAVAFEGADDARPSSIVLTVLTAQIYESMWLERFGGIDDEDALILVVKRMYARLTESAEVWNPVNRKENLNRISAAAWPVFMTRLTALLDCADAAEAAHDEFAAACAWSAAFSYLMPLPETDLVEVEQDSTRMAIMQVPDVRIEVAEDVDFKTSVNTHENEVVEVAKNRWLRFSIANPQLVPPMASIEWTVRNDGADAESLGDLGHTQGGIGLHQVVERTAYAGKQYMDLVIRLNGTVYAARRVAVHIRDNHQLGQKRATPRAWLSLRTRKGRRR
ncbi:hypothetical protein GCM10027034_38190 [Ramlibacter solisilvae]|uniref:Cyclic GMP-AMP synthase n=1 Tax=Ramlibacter tataouinensis TaxID=94132 RepID=A0A127JUL5_9BURK|nr:hypothetical protein [Ramlibacter tataouinensis]AMO23631.1 hypothetical protein UC35_12960 [Ramlibacter tataouinensis]